MMLFFRGLTCQTAVPDSEILSDAIRDFGRAVGCKGNQIFGKQKFSCIFCRPDRLAASPSFRPRRRRSRARRRRPDGPDLSSAPEHFLAAVATAPPPLLCSRAPPRRCSRARRRRPDGPDLSSAPEHFLAAVATAPPPLLCSRAFPRRRRNRPAASPLLPSTSPPLSISPPPSPSSPLSSRPPRRPDHPDRLALTRPAPVLFRSASTTSLRTAALRSGPFEALLPLFCAAFTLFFSKYCAERPLIRNIFVSL